MSTKSLRGSYPHPVLDVTDDVSTGIQLVNTTVETNVEDVSIRFTLRIDDQDMLRFMETGDARLSVRWKCGATLSSAEVEPFETARHVDGVSYEAWIDQKRIRGTVRVEVRVVAARQIVGYSLAAQHPDYGGATFEIQPGDVLADAGYFGFDAAKSYDPFDPPVGSCFNIRIDRSRARGMQVSFGGVEQVDVLMSEQALSGLRDLTRRPDLQISLVVLPALIQTVVFIRENERTKDEELDGMTWYRVIRERMLAVESPGDLDVELAQKILDYPVDRVLRESLFAEDED